MTKKVRGILFIFFVIIFIIVTPLVCMYAAGYQIGKNFSVQKTGILVIKTTPSSANVHLENKTQKNLIDNIISGEKKSYTTPNKIKNLLPGKYAIKIEKDGYWPWEKELQINSGESIYIEHVDLFKNNLPMLVQSQKYNKLIPSPDNRYLLALYEGGADIINSADDSVRTISLATTSQDILLNEDNCAWSPNGDKLLLGYYLYDQINQNKLLDIKKIVDKDATRFTWGESDSNHLYYLAQNRIYSLDINAQIAKTIVNNNATDYIAKNNNLFYLSHGNNSEILKIININNSELIREISLPSSNYIFINRDNNLINVLDKTHNTLYLIDPFSEIKPVIEIINNVKTAHWMNNEKLIFTNDNELWIYNIKYYSKTLLTRISDKIQNAFPFVNEYYIFYTTDGTINVMELDERDKYNVVKLSDLEIIDSPVLNSKGNALYFCSKIGANSGIYKLIIQ